MGFCEYSEELLVYVEGEWFLD